MALKLRMIMQKLHLAEILDVFSQAGVDLRQRVHELCHQQVNLGRRRIEYHHWNILQSSLLGHVCWGVQDDEGKESQSESSMSEPAFDWVCLWQPQPEHCLHLSGKTRSPSPPVKCHMYQSTCFVVINNTLSSWSIRAIGSRDILWKNSQPWGAPAVRAFQFYCLNTVLL